MTGCLEYFIGGLLTQLAEVKQRGEQVIRRDVLVQEYGLKDRQSKAIDHLMQNYKLSIQDYEALYPEVNRRALQRDLKAMIDMELLFRKA